MEFKVVRPKVPGSIVRDPSSRIPLADAGEEKPMNQFWLDRIRLDDVVEVKAPALEAAPKAITHKAGDK